jgi:FlaA1/EpsC-like NDP-sugar epimerase
VKRPAWNHRNQLELESDRGLPERVVSLLRRNGPLALIDLAVVFVAYIAPLVLRFDGRVPPLYWGNFWWFTPVAGLLHLLANYMFGLYGEMWRYASVQEARRVVLAGTTGGALVALIDISLGANVYPLPLSVVALGAAMSLMGFGAIRFQNRLFGFRRRFIEDASRRVLVVGAGDAGAMIVKDLLNHPYLGLDPVALVDDDPRKLHRAMHGISVEGTRAHIPTLVEQLLIDEVLLAAPSATSDVVRDVAGLCEKAGVSLRVLPSRREIVGGKVTARDIRDLRIEDLLGRQQVQTDLDAVAEMLRDRRVLVTGAGGSIGAEIARQVASFSPASLLLLDHDETHLHDLMIDLDGRVGTRIALADIRDRERILGLFRRERPEVVFHAAAHKHVPLLEAHPEEAVFTNVLGTANLADAAAATGVSRFVLISTDKAIGPVNVMGATKWFAEQIVRSLHEHGCAFCAVRFGNVLGSRGSVIPTFFHQIAHGGPVTVTDASMARYFMSVQEAVQLVLQAAALSSGGEVFTLEMGEPMNVLDLARKLIRLSGRVPGKDIAIEIVGPRPGEKIVEDVIDLTEETLPCAHPGIRVSRPVIPNAGALRSAICELEALALADQSDDLRARLRALVTDGARVVTVGAVR